MIRLEIDGLLRTSCRTSRSFAAGCGVVYEPLGISGDGEFTAHPAK
jgi:hypothetical protein